MDARDRVIHHLLDKVEALEKSILFPKPIKKVLGEDVPSIPDDIFIRLGGVDYLVSNAYTNRESNGRTIISYHSNSLEEAVKSKMVKSANLARKNANAKR